MLKERFKKLTCHRFWSVLGEIEENGHTLML